MSEAAPLLSNGERPAGLEHLSRGRLVALGIIIALLAGATYVISVIFNSMAVSQNTGYLNNTVWPVRYYTEHHDGQLPPTLAALVPDSITQENLANCRYRDRRKKERLDWIYFPREKFDGLPPDTILLAAPGTESDASGVERRQVWTAGGWQQYRRIPEADFQRLIREQNPPPAK